MTPGEPDTFSCLLIGEGSLPLRCAEILRNLGHEICGIVSADPSLANWAEQAHVPHCSEIVELASLPIRQPVDYLFSIVNPWILRREILELPCKGAINYHDALLPRYAGTYATSWALLNQEPYHGISWHLMGRRVDAGALLIQRRVDIVAGETAFTLNAKCYEAAAASFHALVSGLSAGRLLTQEQDAEDRTFYGRCKKPAPGGMISWDRDAGQIDALVRALDFGRHPNGLGVPKLLVKGDAFILPKIQVLNSTLNVPPGTVTRIGHDGIRIATATHEVGFAALMTVDGQPITMADFVARWQLREGERLEELDPQVLRRLAALETLLCPHESFWVQRLTQFEPFIDRGSAPVLPDAEPERSVYQPMMIRPEVWRRAPAYGCTGAEFLLAAYAIYLARTGGSLEFGLGFSDVALREKVAGLEASFSSRVPLCFSLNPAHTFAEVCQAVRAEVQLVGRRLTYARDVVSRYPALSSRSPIENGCAWRVSVDWVKEVDDANVPAGSALAFVVAEAQQECRWLYHPGEFPEEEITRKSSQLRTLCDGILAHPESRISELPLQTEAERFQVLVEWNPTSTNYPREASIHALFEAQAERTPEAVAIELNDREVTYRELDHRANGLAHHLQSLGVGPGVLVAVYAERSIELMAGMLAILKAGGAYVPVDPAHPEERARFILSDTRASIILTRRRLQSRLRWFEGRMICMEEPEARVRSVAGPLSRTNAASLAYIMYTSGSTGYPKGVAIPHRGVVRLVKSTNYAELNPAEVFFQVAPAAFDASTFEIWGSLLNGARLVVCPPGTPTLKELAQAIEGHKVTILFLTTGLFHEMVDECLGSFRWVKQMLTGGDVLSPLHAKRFLEAHPDCRLINAYGPTENTSFTCCHVLTAPEPDQVSVPIGRPIANTQVYILDPFRNPVPVGVAGELYAGGDGVALGYWGRPDLTRERFLSDPFGTEPDARLYRTGDLVRHRADGVIEFLGRMDQQVKIRGFRIEPGEIEAVLKQHPGVRDAVVVVAGLAGGEKRLLAYAVGDPSRLTVRELQEFLALNLPDYLRPSALMVLERLPLTSNGKLDRRALPDPVTSPATFIEPCTLLERRVAEVWQDVLGVESVGRDDNFFERGGHSLLALRMVNRLSGLTLGRVPLLLVFQAPILARFAEALQKCIDAPGRDDGSARTIPRLARPGEPNEAVFPASFAQRQLWLVDQLNPGTATYNVPLAWRLMGDLKVGPLERSLEALVHRHDVLRTTFRSGPGGDLQQVIARPLAFALPVIDLRGVAPDELARRTLEQIEAQAWEPFDLGRGPLVRAALLRTSEREHVLVLAFHHIVYDEWSRRLFLNELLVAYEALAAGRPAGFPELPIQYADYAQWQRELLDGPKREEQLRFWRERLAGVPALQLPPARPLPRHGAAAGANQSVEVSPAVTQALKDLGRTDDATLFTTVLTAFKVLLARYSGQDDFAVGSPITNRTSAETEALVGYFLNTLVLRTKLAGDPTFREALRWVRDGVLEAFAHRDLPFDELVEALAPSRDEGVNPLFQVAFVLVEGEAATRSVPGLRFERLEVEDRTAKFDLLLSLTEEPGGLRGAFNYNPALFDGAVVERLARHFGTLLKGIAADPGARLSELPLMEAAERELLVVDWNRTETPFPRDATVSEVFEGQAGRMPAAIAVEHGTTRWSYGELNERANRLAQLLRRAGAGSEGLVGLCLERSAEMVLAMLAVLKAGGAYVPIDPAYPAARRSLMLDGVPVVVTSRRLAGELGAYTGRLLFVEDGQSGSAGTENLPGCCNGGSLAYVIYTSGSTGPPKGVAIPHRAINRLVVNTNYIALDGSDVVAQTANCCFDAATFEIWGALLNGARLVVIDQDVILSPGDFADALRRWGVTTLWLTTSLFNLMAQHDPKAFSGLRNVLFGGEAADARSVAAVLQHGPPRHLLNGYGPTETTTFAACHEVRFVAQNATTIPIGKPIANTTLYVLDAWRNPVPIGVQGEIHVGGPGLARGYLNAPRLTANRFIADPFSALPGARLYRTGDLGRWQTDGTVEFLGRLDQQVKIRGFRIELGEIEAALKAYPDVHDAVVVVAGPASDETRLVAYAASDSRALREDDLRDYLKSTLPLYLVPSTVIVLDHFPLMPNGKVDRKALPVPGKALSERSFVPPRDEIEGRLRAIWAKVLKLPQLGVTDNFFARGGNSMTAVRAFVETNKVFGTNLPVSTLFQRPTVEKLAEMLRTISAEAEWSPMVSIQPQGSRPPFFGIHAGLGNVLFYRELSRLLGNEQPFYGIQSERLTGGTIARTSVEEMAEYYWQEIRKVQPRGPYLVGGYSFGGLVAYEMARRIQKAGERIALLVLFDTGNPAMPPRLRSLRERIGNAFRNPEAFAPDRILQFLAHRSRGRMGDTLLRWSARYREAISSRRNGPGEDAIEEAAAFRIVIAHQRAMLAYRPRLYVGDLTLFRAMSPQTGYVVEPDLGWGSVVSGKVKICDVPGTHWTIFSDENVPALAKTLDEVLRDALTGEAVINPSFAQ